MTAQRSPPETAPCLEFRMYGERKGDGEGAGAPDCTALRYRPMGLGEPPKGTDRACIQGPKANGYMSSLMGAV